jgi:hypothetical protein
MTPTIRAAASGAVLGPLALLAPAQETAAPPAARRGPAFLLEELRVPVPAARHP